MDRDNSRSDRTEQRQKTATAARKKLIIITNP